MFLNFIGNLWTNQATNCCRCLLTSIIYTVFCLSNTRTLGCAHSPKCKENIRIKYMGHQVSTKVIWIIAWIWFCIKFFSLKILEGRSYRLQTPWVGVVNRSQQDINKNVDMIAARRREREYFATTPEYKHMASRMGSEYLGKMLSKVCLFSWM